MDLSACRAEVRELLASSPVMPLVRGAASDKRARTVLRGASPSVWFIGVAHPEAALAGLWLRFGGWEEAHSIAQDLSSAEGSYWHAIVHRQEPDAWNSGYWFRRVGRHAIYAPLLEQARALSAARPGAAFSPGGAWDSLAFIDFCERAGAQGGEAETLALEIQDAEWRLLFEWCARANIKK